MKRNTKRNDIARRTAGLHALASIFFMLLAGVLLQTETVYPAITCLSVAGMFLIFRADALDRLKHKP
jgi:hypothetical protein